MIKGVCEVLQITKLRMEVRYLKTNMEIISWNKPGFWEFYSKNGIDNNMKSSSLSPVASGVGKI